MIDVTKIDWGKMGGLVPAIVQSAMDGRVLMLGYMNEEALRRTIENGKATFFSRSKQRLWIKGETSGNFLMVKSIRLDCDGDALLLTAKPTGPVCHRGTATCFDEGEESAIPSLAFLAQLEAIIEARSGADPKESYTARLFGEGIERCAQKVGEEGVEVAMAALGESKEKLKEESADLIFHLMVLLRRADLSLSDVVDILKKRHNAR
jgi:phosphoribosyl-AMP cyclohydrolase / phosphoribosyl-ATP pyrophosphohydrolase